MHNSKNNLLCQRETGINFWVTSSGKTDEKAAPVLVSRYPLSVQSLWWSNGHIDHPKSGCILLRVSQMLLLVFAISVPEIGEWFSRLPGTVMETNVL